MLNIVLTNMTANHIISIIKTNINSSNKCMLEIEKRAKIFNIAKCIMMPPK